MLQPGNRQQVLISGWKKGIDEHNEYKKGEDELGDRTDEVVCAVCAFEDDGVDTRSLPNDIRSPHEGHNEVEQEIDWKEVSNGRSLSKAATVSSRSRRSMVQGPGVCRLGANDNEGRPQRAAPLQFSGGEQRL